MTDMSKGFPQETVAVQRQLLSPLAIAVIGAIGKNGFRAETVNVDRRYLVAAAPTSAVWGICAGVGMTCIMPSYRAERRAGATFLLLAIPILCP